MENHSELLSDRPPLAEDSDGTVDKEKIAAGEEGDSSARGIPDT